MKEITAYFNTHNEHPLIVLPQLRFMYFPNDVENGYHVHTRFGNDVFQLLENALSREEWDFIVIFDDTSIPTFEIRSKSQLIRCTAFKFLWRDFMIGLKKVQNFARTRLMQRKFSECPSDPFGLRKIKAFAKSDRSKGLPEEIVELIITFCIDKKHSESREFHNKLPRRRIKTDAFQKIARVEREPVIQQ